jgi:hypothetical protein
VAALVFTFAKITRLKLRQFSKSCFNPADERRAPRSYVKKIEAGLLRFRRLCISSETDAIGRESYRSRAQLKLLSRP